MDFQITKLFQTKKDKHKHRTISRSKKSLHHSDILPTQSPGSKENMQEANQNKHYTGKLKAITIAQDINQIHSHRMSLPKTKEYYFFSHTTDGERRSH